MKKIAIVLTLVVLTGCTARDIGRVAGGSLGSLAGATIGHKIGKKVGRVVGASVGGYLGAEFGAKIAQEMSEPSQRQLSETAYETLETGVDGDVGRWTNPNDDAYGDFKVEETKYIDELKTTCRTFTQTVHHKGKAETVKGRACRNPDGTWKIQNDV